MTGVKSSKFSIDSYRCEKTVSTEVCDYIVGGGELTLLLLWVANYGYIQLHSFSANVQSVIGTEAAAVLKTDKCHSVFNVISPSCC